MVLGMTKADLSQEVSCWSSQVLVPFYKELYRDTWMMGGATFYVILY